MNYPWEPVSMRAWCFQDGVIHFSLFLPHGALPVAHCYEGDDIVAWRNRVLGFCALSKGGITHLVPGVVEYYGELAAAAVTVFARRLERLPRIPRSRRDEPART